MLRVIIFHSHTQKLAEPPEEIIKHWENIKSNQDFKNVDFHVKFENALCNHKTSRQDWKY